MAVWTWGNVVLIVSIREMGNTTTFLTGLLGRLNGKEGAYFWIFSTQGRNGIMEAQYTKCVEVQWWAHSKQKRGSYEWK